MSEPDETFAEALFRSLREHPEATRNSMSAFTATTAQIEQMGYGPQEIVRAIAGGIIERADDLPDGSFSWRLTSDAVERLANGDAEASR